MSAPQKVEGGWRCDGCGRVARWDLGWRSYGSMAEQDEDIVRWVACSDACGEKMPEALMANPTPPLGCAGVRADHRAHVERLRAAASHTPSPLSSGQP